MFRAMGSFVSVNKHVMRRGLLLVLVKHSPGGGLVGQGGVGDTVGDTAQGTWQWSHQPTRSSVVPAVLEDGARHVGIVLSVVRLELSVESLLEWGIALASLLLVATAHTHPAPLSTGGLGGQAWPDENKIKVNKNNKNNVNNKLKSVEGGRGGWCYLYIPGVVPQCLARECSDCRDLLRAGEASGSCPARRIPTSLLHLLLHHLLVAAGTVAGNLTIRGC